MPYAATVTTTPVPGGIRVQIAETEAGPSTEASIAGMPKDGTVIRQECFLTGGAVGGATTVDPVLGWATNPTNQQVIVENNVPAASIDNAGDAPYSSEIVESASASTSILYHRSRVNVGTATVLTRYLIKLGW